MDYLNVRNAIEPNFGVKIPVCRSDMSFQSETPYPSRPERQQKNDDVELVTKMTQETQSSRNLVQADPRGGATFPSAARGRMATIDPAASRAARAGGRTVAVSKEVSRGGAGVAHGHRACRFGLRLTVPARAYGFAPECDHPPGSRSSSYAVLGRGICG